MCRDSSVHLTSVLRPSCPPPAWQGSEERTNRLLLLYRVLEAEGAYGGGGRFTVLLPCSVCFMSIT